MRAVRSGCLGAAALFVALTDAAPARADLALDVSRVERAYRASGADVEVLPTRFLWDEEVLTVRLDPKPSTCTTVALVAARGTSFRARLGGIEDREARDRGASIAGVTELSRCDDAPVERVVVSGDAGRGAVEIIVARGLFVAPTLRSILPERTGGVVLTTSEPGPQPTLAPAHKRVESAELRAKSEGAHIEATEKVNVRSDGTGMTEVELDPGCHRIDLLAHEVEGGARARVDVDAELRDSDDETLLARDRSEAADARLYACVGVPVLGAVAFAGAPSSGKVSRVHASWPIPDAVTRAFGPHARARMAGALLSRGLTRLPGAPVWLGQGGSGLTAMPVPVEAGACYVAVVAATRGRMRQLALRASVGALESADERGAQEEGAAIAFCARDRRFVRLEVEARGANPTWALALHRVQSGVWELKR